LTVAAGLPFAFSYRSRSFWTCAISASFTVTLHHFKLPAVNGLGAILQRGQSASRGYRVADGLRACGDRRRPDQARHDSRSRFSFDHHVGFPCQRCGGLAGADFRSHFGLHL
jgi:hypothetical protein